jgi:hypothetical protein
MSQRDDLTPDALRARIEELSRTIELRDRLARLEEQVRRGPGLGSPSAMRTKTPPPGGAGGGGYREELRREFIRTGGYEPL